MEYQQQIVCPYCGKLGRFSQLCSFCGKVHPPDPGSVAFCPHCTKPSILTEEGVLRQATEEDWEGLSREQQEELMALKLRSISGSQSTKTNREETKPCRSRH